MSDDRARVPYKLALEAGRASIGAARQRAAELEPRDWSVLLVVVELTALWSRIEDRVALVEIARLAAWPLPPDDLPPAERARKRRLVARRVAQSLRRLEAVGALTYEPGRAGRPDDDGVSARHFGTVGVPVLGTEVGPQSQEMGTPAARNGHPGRARNGTRGSPPTEVPPKERTEPPGAPLEAGAVGGAGAQARAVADRETTRAGAEAARAALQRRKQT